MFNPPWLHFGNKKMAELLPVPPYRYHIEQPVSWAGSPYYDTYHTEIQQSAGCMHKKPRRRNSGGSDKM
jgi:hypothetical protein